MSAFLKLALMNLLYLMLAVGLMWGWWIWFGLDQRRAGVLMLWAIVILAALDAVLDVILLWLMCRAERGLQVLVPGLVDRLSYKYSGRLRKWAGGGWLNGALGADDAELAYEEQLDERVRATVRPVRKMKWPGVGWKILRAAMVFALFYVLMIKGIEQR